MFGKYKVVTITPVGRRKYIDLLIKYIEANRDIIDEHIFWINTDVSYDISYVYGLASRNPKFYKIKGEMGTNNSSLSTIIANNHNDKTVYIKLSDDICWISNVAIRNLAEFCINNHQFPLVYPLTINTGKTAMFHQVIGIMPTELMKCTTLKFRKLNFNLSALPAESSINIHNWFLKYIVNKPEDDLFGFINKYILYDYEYIPFHAIAWVGNIIIDSNCHYINMHEDIPRSHNSHLCICGNSIISHLSYSCHESEIEQTDIFDRYNQLAESILANK